MSRNFLGISTGKSRSWRAEAKAAVKAEANAEARRERRRERRAALRHLGRSAAFRYRKQLWPLPVYAAAAAGGWLVDDAPVTGVLTLSAAAAGGVVFWLRNRLGRPAEWRYTWACLGLGGAWLLSCSLSSPAAALPVFGPFGVVAAGPWYYHHRYRGGVRTQPAPAEATVPELWERHVAVQGGPAAGSTCGPGTWIAPGVVEHDVQLVPGKQHLGTVQNNLPLIASGLRRAITNVLPEQHPGMEDSSRIRLRVVTASPVRETVFFDEPRWSDGSILLGPHADGIDDAHYRLYTRNSMWGGFILGGPGSGKSRTLEMIVLTALAMGNTIYIYIDGQNGASSATLWEHAHMRAGRVDAPRMLTALERLRDHRNWENREQLRKPGFTPSPQRPGVLVVVDECHAIFPGDHVQRWADFANEVRKVGIAVLAADQDSQLQTVFGQDRLRGALLAGNGIALRTASRTAGNLLPGLDLDPHRLPVLPGFGYYIAAPESGARTAPYRGRYLPDEDDRAAGLPVPVPTVQEQFARHRGPELDLPARLALAEPEGRSTPEQVWAAIPNGNGHGNGDATSLSCGQAILALPWEGVFTRAEIISRLPAGTKVDTVTKALSRLVGDGELEQPDGKWGPYRRVGRV